jgi:hypothetical protein
VAVPHAGAQTLARRGDRFTVDGVPKFLLFVSYFDAMHATAATLDSDFAYIKQKGFDGVRILPNWSYTCAGVHFDSQLFTAAGVVDGSDSTQNMPWNRFKDILDRAHRQGLLVDVTFTHDTYRQPIDVNAYKAAIQTVATRLAGAYPNVLFDVQNEWDINLNDREKVVEIVATVHRADPKRIVTASGCGDCLSFDDAFDVVAFHGGRDQESWYTRMAVSSELARLRSAMARLIRPIYLQEPMPFSRISNCGIAWDSTPNRARLAAQHAKQYGAAAWTFHTRQSFSLTGRTLRAAMGSTTSTQPPWTERDEFEAIPDAVSSVSWGL